MPTINLGKKPKKKEYKRNDNNNDPNRKIRQSFYSSDDWQKLRLAKLYEEPLCEVCKVKGKVERKEILTLAEEVHHLRSFMTGQTYNERAMLFHDFNNLVSICRKCHNEIHNGDLKDCESLFEIEERLKFIKEEEADLKKYLYKGNKD